ncbi:fluoride efflux transporter FluC [Paenibacillus sp. GCM10027626]|uniref:fluoride efflux transporter FluC n=1 Tax=Paenibacillus sp. GCM10027626 TaxID=3273411 RepID=UPI00363830A9
MMVSLMLVALGGFCGAAARYGIVLWVKKQMAAASAYVIMVINLSGSFALGMLAALGSGGSAYLLLGVGFMGAYTTFSTFNVENIQLLRQKKWLPLGINLFGSYILGILLAYTGYIII